jgi:transcriptional regulator GlxA family with amidase domain
MNRRDILASVAGTAIAAAVPQRAFASAGALTAPKDGVLVAFVLGRDATVIDFAGPWEAFGDAMVSSTSTGFGFRMLAVSDTTRPLDLSGMIVAPNYSYADLPYQPNVIVIGAQPDHTPATIAWIRKAAVKADIVMSVCQGAFLLAKTGLLDGLAATTHHDAYKKFAKEFPNVRLVRGPRYVDNGKFACSGGESSGIDLAFHVVERYYGSAIAADAADTMEFTRSTSRPG